MALACQFAASSIDKEAGIIYGVAVITMGAAKGHNLEIDALTLTQVKACAEKYKGGLKVKFDHGSGVMAVAGYLRNFVIDSRILRADLHLLKSEANRAKILEMADTMSDTFGLSVSFSGENEQRAGKSWARCSEIYSADIVSEPAANPNGLFSARHGGRSDFEGVVARIVAKGYGKGTAIELAVRENPDLYADYRKRMEAGTARTL